MQVATEVNFDSRVITIILKKNEKEARLRLSLDALETAFDALQNPIVRNIMKMLGWEVEVK